MEKIKYFDFYLNGKHLNKFLIFFIINFSIK